MSEQQEYYWSIENRTRSANNLQYVVEALEKLQTGYIPDPYSPPDEAESDIKTAYELNVQALKNAIGLYDTYYNGLIDVPAFEKTIADAETWYATRTPITELHPLS
jgi:hypothetical protein